jgi:F0F1-type ATP synthase membrane subunit b/b'
MDSSAQIMFGIVNFLILCALLYWVFGQATNQYFHSRRARIRKQMLSSVMTLRQARGREAKSKERYEELPHDIAERKEAIARSCDKECRQIIVEAHRKAEHMMKAGERRALEERRKHASLIRERLMRSAFRMAEERIRKSMDARERRRHMEKGFAELESARVPEMDVPGSEPKGA